MFKVIYQNHDLGSEGGVMIRESLKRAERTAKLMSECGYCDVKIEKA